MDVKTILVISYFRQELQSKQYVTLSRIERELFEKNIISQDDLKTKYLNSLIANGLIKNTKTTNSVFPQIRIFKNEIDQIYDIKIKPFYIVNLTDQMVGPNNHHTTKAIPKKQSLVNNLSKNDIASKGRSFFNKENLINVVGVSSIRQLSVLFLIFSLIIVTIITFSFRKKKTHIRINKNVPSKIKSSTIQKEPSTINISDSSLHKLYFDHYNLKNYGICDTIFDYIMDEYTIGSLSSGKISEIFMKHEEVKKIILNTNTKQKNVKKPKTQTHKPISYKNIYVQAGSFSDGLLSCNILFDKTVPLGKLSFKIYNINNREIKATGYPDMATVDESIYIDIPLGSNVFYAKYIQFFYNTNNGTKYKSKLTTISFEE